MRRRVVGVAQLSSDRPWLRESYTSRIDRGCRGAEYVHNLVDNFSRKFPCEAATFPYTAARLHGIINLEIKSDNSLCVVWLDLL